MEFSTDWDVDYYKTEYESEEHWELRKRFMVMHKDKFPEDKLVCLAQVFTNVEFMGCKYPDETMKLVAELSKDVAGDFRKERATRIKRTFVQASDAAEARAKARRLPETTKESNTFNISAVLKATKITNSDSEDSENDVAGVRPCFSGASRKNSDENKRNIGFDVSENYYHPLTNTFNQNISINQQEPLFGSFNTPIGYFNASVDKTIDLFAGKFPYGKFILYLVGDRNCLAISGQKCGILITEKEKAVNDQIESEILIGGKTVATYRGATAKDARSKVFDLAVKKLKQECYTIKPNLNPDRINISKNNETVVANLMSSNELKLDQNNVGYKMMQKLGWSGGGLGLRTQGREEPVDFFIKTNRRGFGNNNEDINRNYFRTLLNNYIQSDDIRDLYFESSFTKDERATLHQIASSKNLKSTSQGKEPNRHLVISKKSITPMQILTEVLIRRNPIFINKYEVKVPRSKSNEFPDHIKFKS